MPRNQGRVTPAFSPYRGQIHWLINNIPNELTTTTSGTAEVTANNNGTTVTAKDSGDEATLQGMHRSGNSREETGRAWVIEFGVRSSSEQDENGTLRIGAYEGDDVYVDYLDGTLNTQDNSVDAELPYTLDSLESHHWRITGSTMMGGNPVLVEQFTSGPNYKTWLLSGITAGGGGNVPVGVKAESTSAGDQNSLSLWYFSEYLIPTGELNHHVLHSRG